MMGEFTTRLISSGRNWWNVDTNWKYWELDVFEVYERVLRVGGINYHLHIELGRYL